MRHFLFAALFFCVSAQAQELLAPEQAFRPTAQYIDAKTVEVRYDIAPGYYLYRNKFAFAADGQKLGQPVFPRGQIVQDEFFGKVEIYRDRLLIRLPAPAPAAAGWSLNLTSQGCAEDKLCYPPTTQKVEVKPAPKAP